MKRKISALFEKARLPEASGWIRGARAAVITYHGVTSLSSPSGFLASMRMPIAHFDAHMAYLSRNWNVVTLGSLIRAIRSGIPPRRRTVCVTFDDGYENNFSNAYPVLKRHGIPATIFLTAGAIGDQRPLWHDRLDHVIRSANTSSIDVQGQTLSLRDERERRLAFGRLARHCKSCADSEMRSILDELEHRFGTAVDRDPDARLMTWNDVREMQASGLVEFGAHSLTHAILTRVADADLHREIVEPRELIEKETGVACEVLCYPNGQPSDYSPRIVDLAAAAGYVAGVTTTRGFFGATTDMFRIPRLSISGLTPEVADLAFTLSGIREVLRSSDAPS